MQTLERTCPVTCLIAASVFAISLIVPARASDVKLPAQISLIGFDTGAAAFNMMVAIGQQFKKAYGTDLRVVPASNDVARLAPLRSGRAQFAVPGGGVFYAQEGIDEFGAKSWGPQRLYRVMSSAAPSAQSTLIAKDIGADSIADLKGKRVAWVVGAPSINRPMTAQLAFADLTWADVIKVEFSGYIAQFNGLLNNQVDAVFANSSTGKIMEVERSPRGIFWPKLPHRDEAGWARMLKIAPFFFKQFSTQGTGMSTDHPLEAANYLQPNIVVYQNADAELVYNFVKAMVQQFDAYKDSAPGLDGFGLDRVKPKWVLPFHPAAAKALKEYGIWNDEIQAHNDALIWRQDVLAKAWSKMTDKMSLPDAEFKKTWQVMRSESLRAAGLDSIWETWD